MLHVGDCAYNASKAIVNSGGLATLCSFYADDEWGNVLLSQLEDEGMDTSNIKPLLKKNNTNIILVDENGDKNILFSRDVERSDTNEIYFSAVKDTAKQFKFIHLSHSPWLRGVPFDILRHSKSVIISSDLHIDFDVDGKDKAFISNLDIFFFSGKGCDDVVYTVKSIMGLGPDLVICTLGEEGCIVGNRKEGCMYIFPAIAQKMPIIDTVGAGDVFVGTFLTHYFCDRDLKKSVIKAQIQAGYSCTLRGLGDILDGNAIESIYNKIKHHYFINPKFQIGKI